ncbi:MAG TPA: type VI secretion system baseplate subunit TssK [Steroidobacteraceae bacterium]|nr:type VI secretion system baseplate subunit TssK [Steroidobacteraceae bacterium]
MGINNKVVWSEGLFLRPQHFQQQERYLERYIEARSLGLRSHGWGFLELEIERDLLATGKLALRRARGVWPDGTPFTMPEDDPLPMPLEVANDLRDEIVCLAVPIRRPGAIETDRAERPDSLARYGVRIENVRDVIAGSEADAALEVGLLRARLVPQSQPSEGYASIPLAHVTERRADGQVVLDDRFIPTALVARAAPRLASFMTELQGLLHQRGEALAQRAVATGRAASAEIADFLLLQSVNRYEPLVAHLAGSGTLHPDDAFALLAQIAGDLSTLTTATRRPAPFGTYRHDNLRQSFEPLFTALRASLSAVLEQSAIAIPLLQKKFGVSVATVEDKSLFQGAEFVLAVRAEIAAEDVRRMFPMQSKIGPVEKIKDLVNLQLPGITLRALPVAPRQIPYHTGFAYFGLDQSADLWTQLRVSGGIAVHVSGSFPGLAMELWAVRGQ